MSGTTAKSIAIFIVADAATTTTWRLRDYYVRGSQMAVVLKVVGLYMSHKAVL